MFSSPRLVSARKRRGLTITALSGKSQISTKSISDYENNKKVPSRDTLRHLAEALEVSVAYLSKPPLEEVPAEAVSFRAPTKMTARNREMALSVASHAVELRRWIDERYSVPPIDVPSLHKYVGLAAASEAAYVVRAKWGLGVAPLGNMVHLLELHGVAVFSVKTEARALDAFSFYASGQPFVLLSTAKSAERGRFDAAHELGHLVLHCGPVRPSGVEAEREADAFASSFLMPEADIHAQFSMNPRLGDLTRKKTRWGVSAIALAYRLHDLGLMTDWHYHTTCVNLSRMGYRSGEPQGMRRESSRLLGKVLADLRRTPGGFEQLCNDLAVVPDDVNELIFGLTPTVVSGGQFEHAEREGGSRLTRADLKVLQGGARSRGSGGSRG
ncbi:helix-turn-helix domain-containing protein [Actinopolymorpha singaporensis]|uniref:Zn-dependent peptidase ImmA, M78 family n=1 Tax=Actinopolymorpha singaporensis TaxID=117157 RepID=A0A1H1MVI6_9ACTN|nr:Zn-dependent peptidase ImmA, M78 family [Actinopolymorpha singaporensis]